jgi:hypothetical protein
VVSFGRLKDRSLGSLQRPDVPVKFLDDPLHDLVDLANVEIVASVEAGLGLRGHLVLDHTGRNVGDHLANLTDPGCARHLRAFLKRMVLRRCDDLHHIADPKLSRAK